MRVAFCTPKRPMTLTHHFTSLVQLAAVMRGRGHEVVFQQQVGCALLEHGRSALATLAHDWGADVQLFVDDDVVVTHLEETARMCEVTLELGSVVAAPVLIAGGSRYNVDFLEPNPFDPPRLVMGFARGMGCTAIARVVFDRVIEHSELDKVTFVEGQPKIWPFFRSILSSTEWMGEDTSFCERAMQALDVDHLWADTRTRPEHWGMLPHSAQRVELG